MQIIIIVILLGKYEVILLFNGCDITIGLSHTHTRARVAQMIT